MSREITVAPGAGVHKRIDEAVAALRNELGGRWASGSGNTYPEDFTVIHSANGASVRRGDAGGHEFVAFVTVAS